MRVSASTAVLLVVQVAAVLLSPEASAQKGKGRPGGGDFTGATYTVLQLDDAGGTLPLSGNQMDLNDLGGVVGTVVSNGYDAAAHWQISSSGTQLTLLPGLYSRATGCNNLNEVVGISDPLGGSYWPSPLEPPTSIGNGYYSIPSDINDSGIVCGFSRSGSGASTIRLPTLWNVNGPVGNQFVLPMISGYPQGNATKLSQADENGNFFVLGYLGILIGGNDLHVRWSVHIDLNGSLTADPPSVFSNPSTDRIGVQGMNDFGETCGTFYDESLKWKDKSWLSVGYVPMFWSHAGVPTTLATLPSTVLSPNIAKAANDINNAGTVVGECYAYQSGKKSRSGMFATVWSSAVESPVALETVTTSSPFDSLRNAIAIDASGVIVGTGVVGSQTCGFVAIPNPN